MTLFLKYSDPQGIEQPAVLVALASNIRFGALGLAMSAELGTPDVSTVEVDDPGGTYDFVGLRAFDVRETAAASNNQMIGRFVIQNRTVARSKERSMLTLADRLWTFDLTDYNWHVGKRILIDSDAKRPAETAGDRLRWLLASAAHISLNDYGHVTYPSAAVDAHDYRGETAGTVLSDCCVEDQYDFWVDFNEAHGKPELFFIDPDGSSYASTLSISNFIDDVDSATCFAPYEDASLTRSAERIAFGVYLPYNGGYVYARNTTTGDQFAQVDRAAPMATVHTAAKATRLANKFLTINSSESDRVTVSIKVPAESVNLIRHGHRILARFTHLPGYDLGLFHWFRILHRQVIQDEEGGGSYYRLTLEMVPSGTGIPPTGATGPYAGAAFAGAQLSQGNTGSLFWDASADLPQAGWYANPTVAPLSRVQSGSPFTRLTTSRDITVRIHARAFFTGVVSAGGGVQITATSSVNGVVGSASDTSAGGGGFIGSPTMDVPSYDMVAGEIITFAGAKSGVLTGGWSNVGANDSYIRIGRGTHYWGGGGSTETWVGAS